MAMTLPLQTRIRKIHFASSSAAATEALHKALLQLEGITKIDSDGSQLTIEYEFPASCFADIWQLIGEQVKPARIALLDRLRYSLSAFAEQNERDHRLYPRHWYTYSEDIYVHYFAGRQDNLSDDNKHHWRRYQKKP